MKKFKFKDGSIVTASTVEEAKAKHKVVAANRFKNHLALRRYSGKNFPSKVLKSVKDEFGKDVFVDTFSKEFIACKDEATLNKLKQSLLYANIKDTEEIKVAVGTVLSEKELIKYVNFLGFNVVNEYIVLPLDIKIVPNSLNDVAIDGEGISLVKLHGYIDYEKGYGHYTDEFTNKVYNLEYDPFKGFDYSPLKNVLERNEQKVIKAYENVRDKYFNIYDKIDRFLKSVK